MDDAVPIQYMADGDLGVVAYWDNVDVPIGTIVQRYNSDIVILGQRSGLCYDRILQCRPEVSPKVHILPRGSHIRVVTPALASTIQGLWRNMREDPAIGTGMGIRFPGDATYRIESSMNINFTRPTQPDSNS